MILAAITILVPADRLQVPPLRNVVIGLAVVAIITLGAQMFMQSREDHDLGKKLDVLMAAKGMFPDQLPQPLELVQARHIGAHNSPGIDGEIYRLALSPRTMSWEFLREIYRVQGRPEDATIDCDILLDVYLVNPSKNETQYVKDLRLSVDVNGKQVDAERQNDLRGIDISGKKYEYGLQMGKESGPAEPITPLFSSLPFALSPLQAVKGWVRFTAKDINADKVTANSWKLRVVDSLDVEHAITKVGDGSGKKGEIALRRLAS